MKDVYYVGFYDSPKAGDVKRNIHLAGANKMTYIISAIEKCDKNVNIISASQSLENKICKNTIKKISDKTTLFLPFCFGRSGNIKRFLNFIAIRIQLLYLLIFGVKKDANVIVYHSLAYMKTIGFAKKIKKFRLILEVEEIYGDVLKSEKTVKKELKYFKLADKYIFPTELLNKKINITKKPYVIIHGTYKCEEECYESFDDDKIHVVYSGTFDPRKGGGSAAAAAGWLPENYHVHIIGFGNHEDTENIKRIIVDTNNKSKATVTYDGQFLGEDYICFLQKCHIGMSTQNPDADFNETSFPSKILSYMANGLRVVSIRIPAIESSDVGRDIYYYDKQTPKKIAEAIMKVDFCDSYNSRELIKSLDDTFVLRMKDLLKSEYDCDY